MFAIQAPPAQARGAPLGRTETYRFAEEPEIWEIEYAGPNWGTNLKIPAPRTTPARKRCFDEYQPVKNTGELIVELEAIRRAKELRAAVSHTLKQPYKKERTSWPVLWGERGEAYCFLLRANGQTYTELKGPPHKLKRSRAIQIL